GGGGLSTPHRASAGGAGFAVCERGGVGDPRTASYGRTRSYRQDYLDPVYARLAHDAMLLWSEFERATGTEVLVRCGCLNIAKASVTPDLEASYGQLSADLLRRLDLPVETLDRAMLRERHPYLDADVAHLDPSAGLVDLGAVTEALLRTLVSRGVEVREGIETLAIEPDGALLRVRTDAGDFRSRALVITAGHGTNDVLRTLRGCRLQIPLTRDRPSEAKYYRPPAEVRHRFTSDAMPVVAYLDTGVYVHPIVEGVIDAVKIGYYHPPDLPRGRTGVDNIADFVRQCLPGLGAAQVNDVLDVDQCDYDLVSDDDFVLGSVPGLANVYVGVGWRGTGYKFAPWVGRVLFQLAVQDGTVYDITRFDPARFSPERGAKPDAIPHVEHDAVDRPRKAVR
ncbi:MAG: NAD(P)/FAD-dependent oxidoreductase, partial [Jatrophihabitans sp.]